LEKTKSSKNKSTPLNQEQPLQVLIVTRPNIVGPMDQAALR